MVLPPLTARSVSKVPPLLLASQASENELDEDVAIDRHDDYTAHVLPDLDRWQVGRRKKPNAPDTSWLRNSFSTLPSQESTTLTGGAASSNQGANMGRPGTGVLVRPNLLPRQDAIPHSISGSSGPHGITDPRVRIFVRLPGGGRLALWVPADIRVGPATTKQRDRFTDIWGDDAETHGPSAKARPPGGRMSPFRTLLARQDALAYEDVSTESPSQVLAACDEDAAFGFAALSMSPVGLSKGIGANASQLSLLAPSGSASFGVSTDPVGLEGKTLKELIEVATGLEPARQKLVFGSVGSLERDNLSLCSYDVGHGALLLLSVRSTKGSVDNLAGPLLAKSKREVQMQRSTEEFIRQTKSSRRTARSEVHPTFEHLPEWVVPKTQAVHVEAPQDIKVFDYTFMPDGGIFDYVGRVRKRMTLR